MVNRDKCCFNKERYILTKKKAFRVITKGFEKLVGAWARLDLGYN